MPETAIFLKLINVFGPPSDGFAKYFNDEELAGQLQEAWDLVVERGPNPFNSFTEEVLPNLTDQARNLISSMANLDPRKRALMSNIAVDSYWNSPVQATQHSKSHYPATTMKLTGETTAEGHPRYIF